MLLKEESMPAFQNDQQPQYQSSTGPEVGTQPTHPFGKTLNSTDIEAIKKEIANTLLEILKVERLHNNLETREFIKDTVENILYEVEHRKQFLEQKNFHRMKARENLEKLERLKMSPTTVVSIPVTAIKHDNIGNVKPTFLPRAYKKEDLYVNRNGDSFKMNKVKINTKVDDDMEVDDDIEEEEEEYSEEEDDFSMENNKKGIMPTLKNDAKLVAKRVAARKVVNVTRDLLVSMLSAGKTKKEANNIKNTVGSMLQTENGKAILGFMLGSMLPLILAQLPTKYHSIATEMAQEFRVEGMAHFGTILADFITGPAFQTAKDLITNALDEAVETKETITGIRVMPDDMKSEENLDKQAATVAAMANNKKTNHVNS